MKIKAIKAFNDNYIWALINESNKTVTLVDPGDAEVCLKFLADNQLSLVSLLITHHHWDHTEGIPVLSQHCAKLGHALTVYGPNTPKIPTVTHPVTQDDIVELSHLDVSLQVLSLPGHTLDHIGYLTDDLLFCGDTLFSAGCGRLFDGTLKQMHQSLNKLKQLPGTTKVYCTHEYTLANLNFALSVEPNNRAMVDYYNQVVTLRQQNKSTIPTNIAQELKINPFLRCGENEIKQSAQEYVGQQLLTELEVFTAIRLWKDNF